MLVTFTIDAVVLAAAWAWSRVLRRRSSNAAVSLRDAEVEDDEETLSLLGRSAGRGMEEGGHGAAGEGATERGKPTTYTFFPRDPLFACALSPFTRLGPHVSEAALYLRFHVVACALFLLLSAAGLMLLVPLYMRGPASRYRLYQTSIIEKTMATNLSPASGRLAGTFLAVLAFSAAVMLFVRQYSGDVRAVVAADEDAARATGAAAGSGDTPSCGRGDGDVKEQSPNRVVRQTVLIEGLPRSLSSDEILMSHLRAVFGARVLACQIAVSQSQEPTGRAFVLFATRGFAREAALVYAAGRRRREAAKRRLPSRSFRGKRKHVLDDTLWRAVAAPPPSDVLWDNLWVSRTTRHLRAVAINICLFVLMTLIVCPVAVVDRLEPIVTTIEDAAMPDKLQHREVRRFVGNYLPTLVVFLINSVLLPVVIEATSTVEGHHTESGRAAAVVRRNAAFQFVNTILLPALALESATSALRLAYRTSMADWEAVVGRALQRNTAGIFFAVYLIHATLLGAAAELAQLPQLGAAAVGRCVAWVRGEPARVVSHDQWLFDFGYFYGARLTILGLVLLYSAIVPMLLPLGALYFAVNYWTDRHNLDNGHYRIRFDSNGRLPLAVLRYTLLYVALFQTCMGCYFSVQATTGFLVAGTLLLIAAAVTMCLYLLRWRADSQGVARVGDSELGAAAAQGYAAKPGRDRAAIEEFRRVYTCPYALGKNEAPLRDRAKDPGTEDELQGGTMILLR